MNTDEVVSQMTQMAVFYGPKLIGAILVWIIGGWVIGIIGNVFKTTLKKGGTDPSLMPFLTGIVNGLLKVLLVLTALGMLGIEMTSFIAILGAAGLAVGLAMSGTLQNFSGGVMILIFKPFKVGDVIDAQGYVGTVSQIQIFNTILKTPDNKTIIIPNGGLSTSSMVNYSTEAKRRVDWTIGVGYGDDLDKAREVIKRLCDEDERILKDPEVFIAVSALADSSVNFAVRAWVNAPDYWGVYFQMNEKVYKTFANEGLNIPFPQMDVHIHKDA
ncbi:MULTISPECIES: mechanosensitive ion channel domain-containing protein [unclassified Colwellia]|jgi:small conductance mechanosensitive channel|uniref:mechanosensitive ion channel family protein n=1 Tax=unclassified Colwellia TaxID=196834 RepID=UPI000D3530A1|nr:MULTISPECIES: mechanosensitive ion channel domain-containing protein [unclassified Colwellia]AWB58578.1 mechanosensitive ion channel protein MscS [Colwellia sp. Arc7-D]MBA6416853.1 mechanosensitive ion channel [Colwellia sp. 6M3]|tara:strand:- start:161 stop:976 length:816 start_codon:yes stop_codon:yes gene_type:complete